MHRKPKKLPPSFYTQTAIALSQSLLGKTLVHHLPSQTLRCKIVETEAYLGPHDLASHASKGQTKRNAVMFGPPGHAYIYFIYGMYTMLNITCGKAGEAQAILIRAAEPLDNWQADLSGPGKLARALHITMADNGLPLTSPRLYLEDAPPLPKIARTTRVGVDYSGDWAHELLRFYDPTSPAVSKLPRQRAPGRATRLTKIQKNLRP